MISFVRGTVDRTAPGLVVLDVQGLGLALSVPVPLSARLKVGETARVATELVVRPEQMILFGFSSIQERELFKMLTSISGIGPKLALNVLSAVSPGELAAAILEEDFKTLTAIKGIGKKTGRRIVVELQEKIAELAPEGVSRGSAGPHEAVSMLISLGCSQSEAEELVEKAVAELSEETGAERLVMEAMKILGTAGSGSGV